MMLCTLKIGGSDASTSSAGDRDVTSSNSPPPCEPHNRSLSIASVPAQAANSTPQSP